MTIDQKVRTLAHLANIARECAEARRTLIEDLLTDPSCDLSMRALARHAGVSHTQVTRFARGEVAGLLRSNA